MEPAVEPVVESMTSPKSLSSHYPLTTLTEWVGNYVRSLETSNTDVLLRTVSLLQTSLQDVDDEKLAMLVDTGLETVHILVNLATDADTVAAALLIGPVHEGCLSLEQIRNAVGDDVARMIKDHSHTFLFDRIYNLGSAGNKRDADLHQENLRRLFLALARDIRVVILILASRLVFIRQSKHAPDEVRKAIARETMDIYAPLANRLGIGQIKWEMEDYAFRYLENDRYKQIASWLDEKRADRERYIADFTRQLTQLLKRAGIHGEVSGRPKHIYSIWRKMQRKQLGFEQLYDIRAFRIMVPNVAQCYEVLGMIHSHWPYLKEEFDDYIASPKGNNYQSLHTAIIGPEDRVVEVQIRTYDMHVHAELGVAAHWRYKEGSSADQAFQDKVNWLRQMLEWKQELTGAGDNNDLLKATTFDDRVYVLTPKGRIVDLPMGAMPLDFAYAVHTEVGHHCRGVKLDGKIVPLTTPLKNGQVVDIITAKEGGPSRDWLSSPQNLVTTSKARSKIQQWFKQQDHDLHVESGRSRLEKELNKFRLRDVNLEKLATQMQLDNAEKLFLAIAHGEIKTGQVVNLIKQELAPAAPVAPAPERRPVRRRQHTDILIEGVGDLLVNYGKCCNPVPGDDVIGYITRTRGVTVHRTDCNNVKRYQQMSPERLLDVQWSESHNNRYPVDIHVSAEDRQGLVRDVTALLANEKLNIYSVNTYTDRNSQIAHMKFSVEIADLDQLQKVLKQLTQLPDVIEVLRKS